MFSCVNPAVFQAVYGATCRAVSCCVLQHDYHFPDFMSGTNKTADTILQKTGILTVWPSFNMALHKIQCSGVPLTSYLLVISLKRSAMSIFQSSHPLKPPLLFFFLYTMPQFRVFRPYPAFFPCFLNIGHKY